MERAHHLHAAGFRLITGSGAVRSNVQYLARSASGEFDYPVQEPASIYASTADFARCPPSTTSELPVMNAASSESRKATA